MGWGATEAGEAKEVGHLGVDGLSHCPRCGHKYHLTVRAVLCLQVGVEVEVEVEVEEKEELQV